MKQKKTQVEKGTARTKEEKRIAEERRMAEEAEAKMELHEAKAMHAAERLHGHLHGYVEPTPLGHGGHVPQVHGYVDPTQPERVTDPALHGTPAAPTYPPSGGHRPGHIL